MKHQQASTGQIVGADEPLKPTLVKSTMQVKVYSPFRVYFDQEANSISAVNNTGPFDILPRHHNFMTLLTPGTIIIRTDAGEQKILISRGIMHVKANQVIVFLDV